MTGDVLRDSRTSASTAPSFRLFASLGPAAPRPISAWLPIAAGLGAAGWFAWAACPVPRLHDLSWAGLWLLVLRYTGATFVTVAAVSYGVFAVLPGKPDVRFGGFALRLAAVGALAAPAAIFLKDRSGWSMAPAVVLAAGLTRFAAGYSRAVDRSAGEEPASVLGFAVCASLFAHLAAAAGMSGYVFTAAALAGASASVVMWGAVRTGLGQTRLRIAPGLVCALVFTAAGLTRCLDAGALRWGWSAGDEEGAAEEFKEPARFDAPAVALTYPGVILWPESKPHTTLVPPLPALAGGLFEAGNSTPLSIPFFGSYSFYKAKDGRMPRNPAHFQGSPENIGFVSTDGSPLRMEAHQNLGKPIDIACCSGVRIAIRNADTWAGTILLEAILAYGKERQSLGKATVTSVGPRRRKPDRPYVEETLTFAFPGAPAIRQFDEIRVVFDLGKIRADRSAKVGIDRFMLVPRL